MKYRIIWRRKMKEPKNRKSRKKKIILSAAILIVIGLVVVFNLRSKREKSVRVTVEKVTTHDLTSLISASGEVKPKKNVNISAHVPGRIVKIGVVEGEEVKAGDFLLKLDSAQYEANAERDRALIQSYKAQLIQSEARLKREQNNYARQQKLYDDHLVSLEQLESAKVQYDIALAEVKAIRHQVQQAEASLKSTLDSLSKTVYNSPIDGIITSLRVEEGEVAIIGTMNNPGTVLMTIADLSEMEVEVEVDETDVVGVRLGQKAEVKVDALPYQTLTGTVTKIGSSAIQKITASQRESRDFQVTITLENPPHTLRPGLSASADIITARKESVLAIPISALVLKEEEGQALSQKQKKETEGVYVVEDGRAKFCPVTRGIMGGLLVEITSGLQEGQEVIVGPYSALRELKDGVLIKPETKREG
ncbi:MAG: efflux RND transporter periplasmic adaptor subunit [Candidatus Aminicenantes bacterium]|nr:efflux RND transporter periplasmic adaptor subunit [Candidatus Aminicenantes bacterium]